VPIRIIYHDTEGAVTIMPFGYDGQTCHDAAAVYEDTRSGKRVLTAGEAAGLSEATVAESTAITQKASA
jgi:hypothetical protein